MVNFGKVSYDSTGKAENAYYTALSTETQAVQFSIAFKGLGLPSSLYDQWKSLMVQTVPSL